MKLLKNLSTRNKLMSTFFIMVILISFTTYSHWKNIDALNVCLDTMFDKNISELRYVSSSQTSLEKIRADSLALLFTQSAAEKNELVQSIEEDLASIQAVLDEYNLSSEDDEEQEDVLNSLQDYITAYAALLNKLEKLVQNGDIRAAKSLQDNEMEQIEMVLFTQLSDLYEKEEEETLEYKLYGEEMSHDALIQIAIFTIIAILLAITLAFLIGKHIADPLLEASRHLLHISRGDFTQSIPHDLIERKDEIGTLGHGLVEIQHKFSELIGNVGLSSCEVAASSEQMSANTQNLSATMEEISASTEEITAGMEEVLLTIRKINANGENISSLMKELNAQTSDGNERATQIANRATKMQRDFEESKNSAMDMHQTIESDLQQAISDAAVVNEISSLAESIGSIADQTNLLALNAAIEAARAGEQGLGFAVVAEEVRKLAEESTSSVSNIQHLTVQVQQAIENLIKSSTQLLNFISDINIKAYESMDSVASYYESDALLFASLTEKISHLANQVELAVEMVNPTVVSATQAMEQSTSGAQQISLGTEHASASLIDTSHSGEKLAAMASHLNELIAKFKISSETSETNNSDN